MRVCQIYRLQKAYLFTSNRLSPGMNSCILYEVTDMHDFLHAIYLNDSGFNCLNSKHEDWKLCVGIRDLIVSHFHTM
jgi:hypothetical protein